MLERGEEKRKGEERRRGEVRRGNTIYNSVEENDKHWRSCFPGDFFE
jgi:hypothetical protein